MIELRVLKINLYQLLGDLFVISLKCLINLSTYQVENSPALVVQLAAAVGLHLDLDEEHTHLVDFDLQLVVDTLRPAELVEQMNQEELEYVDPAKVVVVPV